MLRNALMERISALNQPGDSPVGVPRMAGRRHRQIVDLADERLGVPGRGLELTFAAARLSDPIDAVVFPGVEGFEPSSPRKGIGRGL